MKKFLIIYILVLAALSVILFKWASGTLFAVQDDPDPTIKALMQDLKKGQDNYFAINGKYKYVPTRTENGITRKEFEYVCPDGSKGNHIYLEKADGSKKSFGEGCDAEALSYEWTTPVPVSTTP